MLKFIELSIGKIAYYLSESSDNENSLVFLHDSLGCIELWRDFPAKLASSANCNYLIYDRQGYGKSAEFSYANRSINYLEDEADLLYELLTKLNISNPILYGHSDGGSIALIAASKYNSFIKAVVTEGAHVFVEDITLKGINNAKQQYLTTDLKSRLEKYHAEKTDAMFSAWVDTWTSHEFQNWNIEHFLSNIECPVLVIQGDKDEFGSLAQVKSITRQTKYSEEFIVPDSTHNPHKENPELLIIKIAQYINKRKTP